MCAAVRLPRRGGQTATRIRETDPPQGSSWVFSRIACTKVALLLIFEADGRTEEKLFRSAQKASDGVIGCSPQVFFGCNSLHDDLQSLVKEAESALEYGQLAGYRSVFFDKMALSFPPSASGGLKPGGKSLPFRCPWKKCRCGIETAFRGLLRSERCLRSVCLRLSFGSADPRHGGDGFLRR